MSQSGSKKKVANSLVAMSSAAVLAVYAAGFTRTRSAAQRFEAQSEERRPAIPGTPRTPATTEASPAAPAANVGATSPTAPAPAATPVTTPEPKLIASAEPARTTPHVTGSAATPPRPADEQPPSSPANPLAAPIPTPAPEPAAPALEHKVELAPAPVPPAPAAPAPPPAPVWKDGTYTGWGRSRHGDIQASVVIEGGHIESATIAQCWTRYSCSVIDRLPPEVAQRQSPEVDYVSGATQSANAFYYAVVEALSKAK